MAVFSISLVISSKETPAFVGLYSVRLAYTHINNRFFFFKFSLQPRVKVVEDFFLGPL